MDERGDGQMHGRESRRRLSPLSQELFGERDIGERPVPVAEAETRRRPEIEAVQPLDRRTRRRFVEPRVCELDGLSVPSGVQRPPRGHRVDVSHLVGVGELGREVQTPTNGLFHGPIAPERLVDGSYPVERRRLEVDATETFGHRGGLLAGSKSQLHLVVVRLRPAVGERTERARDEEPDPFLAVTRSRSGQPDLQVPLAFFAGHAMAHRSARPRDDLQRGRAQASHGR